MNDKRRWLALLLILLSLSCNRGYVSDHGLFDPAARDPGKDRICFLVISSESFRPVEGVVISSIDLEGSLTSLGTTRSLDGALCVDKSIVSKTYNIGISLCRDGYFCGGLRIDIGDSKKFLLEFQEFMVALAAVPEDEIAAEGNVDEACLKVSSARDQRPVQHAEVMILEPGVGWVEAGQTDQQGLFCGSAEEPLSAIEQPIMFCHIDYYCHITGQSSRGNDIGNILLSPFVLG